MSHNKGHIQGRVPFSWENKPGVSKVTHHECPTEKEGHTLKLPPPPCPSGSRKVPLHDLHIPLPPCTFQTPSRSSSMKGLRRQEDDPFLAAYKECTKSVRNGKKPNDHSKKGVGSGVGKTKFSFSCKNSCDVRDDNLVRFSNLPHVFREKLWESR